MVADPQRPLCSVCELGTCHATKRDSAVAMGNPFSATERLIRAALKAEGVQGEVLNQTLHLLLQYCVSENQKFLNLSGMCYDVRALYALGTKRTAVEHGTYKRDQFELSKGGWNPPDPDKAYLEIIDHRLVGAHQILSFFL
jgi:hypothetical protein